MTDTNLNVLLAACDLTDANERLMLADAYLDAGRRQDADALRTDHADELSDLPHWTQHVRQTTGYSEPDEFGHIMSYEREVTIQTDFRDHSNGEKWESLHPADRRWWIDVLAEMHRVDFRLASAEPEVRELVEERMVQYQYHDLETLTGIMNDLIDEAKAEVASA